jgi:hypothetical protein
MLNLSGFTNISESDKKFESSENTILKGFINNDLEKGGEGSRGGKVIGHTQSGKPIYENFEHKGHKNFTKTDHEDALLTHYSKREHESWNNKGKKSEEHDFHQREENKHKKAAANLNDKTKETKEEKSDKKEEKPKDKKLKLKEEVIAKLIKNGNNPEDAKKMVEKHFEYASGTYDTVKTIAEAIRTIY